MNKTSITLVLLFVNWFYLSAQVESQGFDQDNDVDNWSFSTNIPFYSANNNTDVWNILSSPLGRIPGPFSEPSYIAGRDLDNDFSEQYTTLDSPEHILTFDAVTINGLEAELKFRIFYFGLDNGDYVYFELLYDDNSNWLLPDHREDVFLTTQNGNFFSNDWEEISYTIPSGKNSIRMRLVVYQNGNEYIGFDDFSLTTSTLSSNNNLIEGFSFGPNPTRGSLKLKANVNLDRIVISSVLGKELINVKVNTKEKSLDLSSFSSGIYIAKAISGEKAQTFKIIKK
ncbi:MAG: T9SS type A sorting domain-containing protein [Flavobacteriaceae bacterium]|nr:T9SS type A sorting domain-containing protein [Flavobacteriaceae bacterium]